MLSLERSNTVSFDWLVGWLVGFYAISTLLGYLISNSVYTYSYIRYIGFVNEYFVSNTLKELDLICFHTAKWFQVLLLNTNNYF